MMRSESVIGPIQKRKGRVQPKVAVLPKVFPELPWSLLKQRMLLIEVAPHATYRAPCVQLRTTQNRVVVPDHTWVVRDRTRYHRGRTIFGLMVLFSTIVAALHHGY